MTAVTVVWTSIISDTRMRYGSAVDRQGKSRRASRYHAISRSRIAAAHSKSWSKPHISNGSAGDDNRCLFMEMALFGTESHGFNEASLSESQCEKRVWTLRKRTLHLGHEKRVAASGRSLLWGQKTPRASSGKGEIGPSSEPGNNPTDRYPRQRSCFEHGQGGDCISTANASIFRGLSISRFRDLCGCTSPGWACDHAKPPAVPATATKQSTTSTHRTLCARLSTLQYNMVCKFR